MEQINIIDAQKEKIIILENLLKEKIAQINSSKEHIKNSAIFLNGKKESSKNIISFLGQKKLELFSLLENEKILPVAFKQALQLIELTEATALDQFQENELALLVKQNEVKVAIQDFTRMKNMHTELVEKLQTLQAENVIKEVQPVVDEKVVRPDQNKNTRAGRASLDLIERRKKGKRLE